MELIKTSNVFVFVTDFTELSITTMCTHILHWIREKSEDMARLSIVFIVW